MLGISARSHVDAAARAGAHGRRVARKRGAHGQAQRERDDRPVGSSSSELDGLRLRGGHGVGLRLRQEAAERAAAEALCGAAGAGGAAPPGRHAGLPRGRDEAVAGQQQGAAHGGGAPQTTEVERGGRPYKPLPGGQLPAARTAPRRTWAWGRRRPTTGCAGTCAGAVRKSWPAWG